MDQLTEHIAFIILYLLLFTSWGVFLFEALGESGFKALIPFYNFYTWCRVVWSKHIFFMCIFTTITGGLLLYAGIVDYFEYGPGFFLIISGCLILFVNVCLKLKLILKSLIAVME